MIASAMTSQNWEKDPSAPAHVVLVVSSSPLHDPCRLQRYKLQGQSLEVSALGTYKWN
jgi:hypothetical protein